MGLFGDAGVNVSNIGDDHYNFGNDFHPLFLKEVRKPKVSDTGKFGVYVICEIAADKYAKVRPFGRWIQLPTPKEVCEKFGTTFDPENDPQDAKVVGFLIKWFIALGFKMDEIQADVPDPATNLQGKIFLARLKAMENDQGYDDILWRNPSALPDGDLSGLAEFKPKADTPAEKAAANPADAIAAALSAEVDEA